MTKPLAVIGIIATVNGLLLGLCWSSFGKIFDALGDPAFARFLDNGGLLKGYHFFVSFIQVTQVLALLVSFGALFIALFDSLLPLWAHRASIGAVLATTLYALWYATEAVGMMQDLVWHKVRFDEARSDTAGGVVPFRQGDK